MLNIVTKMQGNMNFLFQRSTKLTFFKALSQNAASHYDIVIAGGGMVGTTLACTLGKNKKLYDKSLLLLEGSKVKPWSLPEKYSNRVVSINQGTYKLLNDIGAWGLIEKSRVATVRRMQVWDALSDASITFGSPEHTETVSYIVENDLLLAAVSQEAKKCNNLVIVDGVKVKSYELPIAREAVVKITLENGECLTCDLLGIPLVIDFHILYFFNNF